MALATAEFELKDIEMGELERTEMREGGGRGTARRRREGR